MNKMIILGIVSAGVLIAACFFPWITVTSKSIVVSGVAAEGTYFGKPGYLHFIFTAFYLIFLIINKLWSRRINIFLSALNLTWAVRNFLIISTCRGGECPEKHAALYLTLISSVLMLVVVLFANARLEESSKQDEEVQSI